MPRTKGLGKNWYAVWEQIDMNKISSGDTRAINQAYELLQPTIYFNMKTQLELEREEIYNNFFVKFCRYAPNFDKTKGTLYSWTLTMQKQIETQYFNTKATRRKYYISLDEPAPNEDYIKKEYSLQDGISFEKWTDEEKEELNFRLSKLSDEERNFLDFYLSREKKVKSDAYIYKKIVAKLKKEIE